ncbi:hypothetical protein [Ralstonia pseudosolanacearum]|uniref:hypothetical protein n=1 Tax=Ralstonia pseudosolanacearum TaxID=1310165 RepID=UPI0018D1A307|nr:hypothetical protein [Ralstonia pseudosolanacearum]
MDIERFEKLVRDPKRTRDELESMKENALKKGQTEFAKLANDVLSERFPPRKTKRGGGATPTTATFRSRSENFDTGKAAYLWLVDRFCDHRPDALERYIALHKRAGSPDQGSHFARDPDLLFRKGSNRRGDSSNYVCLSSGWYAGTTLSHDSKFAVLMQLSYVSGLEYEVDWDFRVTGATEELKGHQQAVIKAREFLNELLAADGPPQ